MRFSGNGSVWHTTYHKTQFLSNHPSFTQYTQERYDCKYYATYTKKPTDSSSFIILNAFNLIQQKNKR